MLDVPSAGQVWEEPDWGGRDDPWVYLVLSRENNDYWRLLVLTGAPQFVGHTTTAPNHWFGSSETRRLA